MSNDSITNSAPWLALSQHKTDVESRSIKALFDDNPSRFDEFSLNLDGLLFDYSKHRINQKTIELLCDLARHRGLEDKRSAMVNGDAINTTEERAVLHMALRGSVSTDLSVDGENISRFVSDTQARIKKISEDIRTDHTITDIVNIGIGGSDLGPRMAYKALMPFHNGPSVHFVSNIDGRSIEKRLSGLNPETTLVIMTSKTFMTLETLNNAKATKAWLLKTIAPENLSDHLIAVTNATEKAIEFGVKTDHILPLRDWIGGRFSLWSAVGLPIAIACGYEVFEDLLAGAKAADDHFLNAPLDRNIPILMGILGVWYRNFWDYPVHAVLPYSHDFRDIPRFIQQLDMESNGKGVDTHLQTLTYASGPIIFGEAGTNAQHAFMQLMHQGSTIIPADFILSINAYHDLPEHQMHLISNALAQSKALMEGKEDKSAPHKNFDGNRPSSIFMLDKPDAYRLGMLLAFYEHKIFVQGVIWGINSFDQWGVELGKSMATTLFDDLNTGNQAHNYDASTAGLLENFHANFTKS